VTVLITSKSGWISYNELRIVRLSFWRRLELGKLGSPPVSYRLQEETGMEGNNYSIFSIPGKKRRRMDKVAIVYFFGAFI